MHHARPDRSSITRRLRHFALGLFLCTQLFLMPTPALATLSSFFSVPQTRSSDLSAFTKWTGMLARYASERGVAKADCKDGEQCDGIPVAMQELIKSQHGKPLKKQLQAVNDFFNKIPYVTDADNWGVEDYWETPNEFLARGGDCEDYAIAKYMALKELGVPESQMRVMVVTDMNLNGEMHSVLEVKIKGVSYILDNQAAQVIAEQNIYHYRPIYALNEASWWAYQ